MNTQQFITLYPELTPSDDGRFACLSLTLPDGRYICVTNMGGMGYPSADDFMVCVYRNERELGEQSLGCFTSDKFDIEDALNTATWLTMGDLGEVQS